jgi:sulfide:quinone oxidoreductase
MKTHFQVLFVGGGNAGLSAAAHLLIKKPSLSVGIIEPSDKHYYQPAWTLVGGGIFDIKDTEKNEADFIPKGATWIKEYAQSFQPDQNEVTTREGHTYTYDYLVVCPGIQLNWNEIKGLPEALGQNGVTSNYLFKYAPYTFEVLKALKGGRMIFHSPNTPVKCGGAPQKIMYLAADYLRKHNLLDKSSVEFWSGGTKIFGVPKYEKTLLKVIERYNIKTHFFQKLVEVDGPNKRAKFLGLAEGHKNEETWVDFDMLHITPPQGPPDFIKNSPLANAAGWIDVDKSTLQHVRYANVFSLGDASSLPTSKTGAAIRKQTPVMVANLLSQMEKKPLTKAYNGYTSCPIVTGYGKLMLAEFDYNNQPMETFPFDQSKERWSMFFLKKQILPRLYWGAIVHGRMQG